VSIIILILAIIGGFAVGAFIGMGFACFIPYTKAVFKSKRVCHECLRTRVEYGFHVDGKEYRCVEKEGGAA